MVVGVIALSTHGFINHDMDVVIRRVCKGKTVTLMSWSYNAQGAGVPAVRASGGVMSSNFQAGLLKSRFWSYVKFFGIP